MMVVAHETLIAKPGEKSTAIIPSASKTNSKRPINGILAIQRHWRHSASSQLLTTGTPHAPAHSVVNLQSFVPPVLAGFGVVQLLTCCQILASLGT
jgi:hypothetical protein